MAIRRLRNLRHRRRSAAERECNRKNGGLHAHGHSLPFALCGADGRKHGFYVCGNLFRDVSDNNAA